MIKRIVLCLLVAFTLLISGCTSKFAYNNIDWMLYWYVDDYIDLDKNQKQILDPKIEKWLVWHRAKELPAYRQHLLDLKAQLQQGEIDNQQWLQHFLRGRMHWQRFRDQVIPELSVLALQLTDQQITDMFDELEKANLKTIKERNEDSLEERIADSKKSTQKQMKQWLGKLSAQQIAIINSYEDQYKSTFDTWIIYRRSMQLEVKKMMLQRHQVNNFPDKLTDMLANPERYRSDEYQQANDYNRQVIANMLAELMTTLTSKQQEKAIDEIDDLIDDLEDLIED